MTSLFDSSWTTQPVQSGKPNIARTCSPQSNWSQPSTGSTISIGEVRKHHKKRRKRRRPLSNAQWRSIALEKTYVHDVYSLLASKNSLLNASVDNTRTTALYSRVRNFLNQQTEPGSMILDLGCGNSNYAQSNDLFVIIGLDRCSAWFDNNNCNENTPNLSIVGDCLRLPFKDSYFDAILCVNVLHHLSTVRRRISALKQISRCLKIGGKVLITVRGPNSTLKQLESRDLLIRVNNFNPNYSDSDSSSFDDSDSDCENENQILNNNHVKYSCNVQNSKYSNFTSPSSSDLDNCYAFMKKTLKRLSMTRTFYPQKNNQQSLDCERNSNSNSSIPNNENEEKLFAIELRNLDPEADSLMRSNSSAESLFVDSFSSPTSGPTTSSSGFFSASFLSNIREHFITWRSQFISNSVWHSLDTKLSAFSETQFINDEPLSHRFSLPLNFLKPELNNSKNILSRNKVHVSSNDKPAIVQFISGERSLKLNLPSAISSRLNYQTNFNYPSHDSHHHSHQDCLSSQNFHEFRTFQIINNTKIRHHSLSNLIILPELSQNHLSKCIHRSMPSLTTGKFSNSASILLILA